GSWLGGYKAMINSPGIWGRLNHFSVNRGSRTGLRKSPAEGFSPLRYHDECQNNYGHNDQSNHEETHEVSDPLATQQSRQQHQ
ncbi:hypothetical protein Tco_0507295, partial [Tanacetum coccineum]